MATAAAPANQTADLDAALSQTGASIVILCPSVLKAEQLLCSVMEYLRGCFGMIVANGTGVVNVFCEECKTFHFLKRLRKGAIPTGSGMIIRSAVYPINSCALDISGIARLSNIEH
jgi:hypothetical protein